MGWLRLVGFLKLQASFAKEPYKTDYILQKRPIILLIRGGYKEMKGERQKERERV